MIFNREPKVRLSDVALLIAATKEIFEAGVAANKVELPEQIMLTPKQVEAEQAEMMRQAGWIATGDGDGEEEE